MGEITHDQMEAALNGDASTGEVLDMAREYVKQQRAASVRVVKIIAENDTDKVSEKDEYWMDLPPRTSLAIIEHPAEAAAKDAEIARLTAILKVPDAQREGWLKVGEALNAKDAELSRLTARVRVLEEADIYWLDGDEEGSQSDSNEHPMATDADPGTVLHFRCAHTLPDEFYRVVGDGDRNGDLVRLTPEEEQVEIKRLDEEARARRKHFAELNAARATDALRAATPQADAGGGEK